MEKLEFLDIHKVITETLNISDNSKLEIIGSWFFKFLNSEEEDLKLSIPSYEYEFSIIAYDYLRLFSITFYLVKESQINTYENTCLFNVFIYNPKIDVKNINDFILDFKTIKNNIALWNVDTNTELNQFIPVFNRDQITSEKDLKIIYNSFNLFKAIRKHKLINYPILIDLHKNILSFNIFKDFIPKIKVSENIILVDKKIDDEFAEEMEDKLIENIIKLRIDIKYPNSKRPHDYLLGNNIGPKRFSLIYMNRFANEDENKFGIRLLPREYSEKKSVSILNNFDFEIVNTKHNKSLYDLLSNFKKKWKNLGLNKNVTPFPRIWFLLVNKGYSKEEWHIQFENDYPEIANKPIINDVKKIISELHDLDWIKDAFANFSNSKFLFPELMGLKKKMLGSAFRRFEDYTKKLYPNLVFIEEKLDNDYKNIILLDAFNKVDIVNKGQLSLNGDLKIIVPDFIYYNYQPFIKYYLFDYQSSILINSSREKLDINFETNKEKILSLKSLLFKEINSEIKNYNNKYNVEIDEPSIENIKNDEENDNELTGAEEAEFAQRVSFTKNPLTFIITTIKNEEINTLENEMVLVRRNCISTIPVKALIVGDLFLQNKDLNNLIMDDNLYNRLSEIPTKIKSYQNELLQYKDIYNKLKIKGISYSNETYFKNTYLLPIEKINNNSFRVPRRKKDWRTICDLLTIGQSEMDIAFIAYYGREKKNRIKELYKEVINLFLEKEYFSMAEDPIVLSEMESIVEKFQDIFKLDNYYNPQEITISIASTIMNELQFKEIKNLKYE